MRMHAAVDREHLSQKADVDTTDGKTTVGEAAK